MKNSFFAGALLAPLLLACAKSETAPKLLDANGCAEVSPVPVTAHSITPGEVQQANALFARNNIDNRRYRYAQYSREALQTYFPPYEKVDFQLVKVEEYANGLRIFTGHLNYSFKNGVFNFLGGRPARGVAVLDAVPNLSPGQLRALFLASIDEFDPQRSNLEEQCVSLEFGYYDLNAGTGNADENIVKAWKVTFKNKEYPYGYYQDVAGKLIRYDNGIRTFPK
jgi:hypothetical protein